MATSKYTWIGYGSLVSLDGQMESATVEHKTIGLVFHKPTAMAPAALHGKEWHDEHEVDTLLTELLEGAGDETDAWLAELLGDEAPCGITWAADESMQLPQSPSSLTSQPEEAMPHAQHPVSATHASIRCTTPAKRMDYRTQTLSDVRDEVDQLTNELQRLRSTASSAFKAIALDERMKRRRVEDECRQLREAVYAHTQFLRGLRSVVVIPLSLSPLDVAHYLHSYTQLTSDRSKRWSEYAALAQGTRFQAAMDMLCRETREMTIGDKPAEILPSLDAPFLWSELLKHHDGFSMASINVYALETDDLSAALRGVCVAVREIPARDPAYDCVSRRKQLVDPDAALPSAADGSSIIYRVMGVEHRNNDDELTVESHNITLYRQTDDHALLLEDFVDDDELHPHDASADITRQVVGACLIRSERCSDGLERTVVRTLRTRRYRFHEHTPPAILQRFQRLISATMEPNDLLFRQFIVETISDEEKALAQAMELMESS